MSSGPVPESPTLAIPRSSRSLTLRALFTLDKDFGELAILKGAPHAGVVRLVRIRARDQGPTAVQILTAHETDLLARAILTVEPDRVRIRLPESRADSNREVPEK